MKRGGATYTSEENNVSYIHYGCNIMRGALCITCCFLPSLLLLHLFLFLRVHASLSRDVELDLLGSEMERLLEHIGGPQGRTWSATASHITPLF